MERKFLGYFLVIGLMGALPLSSFVAIPDSVQKTNYPMIDGKTDSVLRHVVLFKFKEGTTSKDLKAIETAFAELPDKIGEIHGFEWGLNSSPEGLDKGFTHCFLVTFLSGEARDRYLPHPDHQAFVKVATPHIEDVLVMDYWSK